MNDEIILTVQPDDYGKRIDVYISEQCDDISRSMAQKFIDSGDILVNDISVSKNYKLKPDDVVYIPEKEPTAIQAIAQDIPLCVVYEDADIIVINKAKGMVVHPAAGNLDGTMVNALLFHCGGSLSGINGEIRPGIVHRIDKDTSGLIVVAKNDKAHESLAGQIKEHSAGRTYQAIIIGHLKQASGTISAPIGRCPSDRKKMAVVQNGRTAITHYETIAEYTGYSHIKCQLETGRTHQIRVHFANIGHPLAGDTVYGSSKPVLEGGQCLHACELRLKHPTTGQEMTFTAPLPQYFADFLRKISS